MSEHTKGTWRVSGTGFVVAYDEVIGNDISLANARRIVACVNFCEGVQTLELESAPKHLKLRSLLDVIDNDLAAYMDAVAARNANRQ